MKKACVSLLASCLLFCGFAFAGAYADLVKSETAFKQATSWHVVEHFADGRTVTVDYSARTAGASGRQRA